MSRKIQIQWGDKVIQETIEGNIELSDLTPTEVMDALNRAVGRFAYYGALRADAKKMQSKINTEYNIWWAERFREVSHNPEMKKATAKAIESELILNNSRDYSKWENRKRTIEEVCDKLYVLVNSFELMTKTLQSVLATLRVEMDTTAKGGGPIRGRGDLRDE